MVVSRSLPHKSVCTSSTRLKNLRRRISGRHFQVLSSHSGQVRKLLLVSQSSTPILKCLPSTSVILFCTQNLLNAFLGLHQRSSHRVCGRPWSLAFLNPESTFPICYRIELRKVAVLALSPPTAAGATESNWSTYSFIVNMQRKRLEPERSKKLVLVHYIQQKTYSQNEAC